MAKPMRFIFKIIVELVGWEFVTTIVQCYTMVSEGAGRDRKLLTASSRVSHIMPALNLALNADFEKKH